MGCNPLLASTNNAPMNMNVQILKILLLILLVYIQSGIIESYGNLKILLKNGHFDFHSSCIIYIHIMHRIPITPVLPHLSFSVFYFHVLIAAIYCVRSSVSL
jgi:hypothetical protein